MPGEEELFEFFDDLEAQAAALHHRERSVEVADRARSEYRTVTLDSRLMASVGLEVELEVAGVGRVAGELQRVGPGWCQVVRDRARWTVCTGSVRHVAGASPRSVPEQAWSPVQRLTVASALRRLADAGASGVVVLADGARHEGRVQRIGADFVELATPSRLLLLPLAHLAAVRSED